MTLLLDPQAARLLSQEVERIYNVAQVDAQLIAEKLIREHRNRANKLLAARLKTLHALR